MKAKSLYSLFLGILLVATAGAETPAAPKAKAAYAEIVFVQGTDLLLLRSDGQTISGEPMGARLSTGDQIQTGPKTTVELVTMPRKSRLRLSENTVVTIGSLGNDGSTSLKLLYGRLRSKVEKLAGTPPPYDVVSRTFMAGVRGTDFGCDVLVARAGEQASAKVYCFEGSVEVAPPNPEYAEQAVKQADDTGKEGLNQNKAPEAAGAFAPVLVAAGTMAVVADNGSEKAIIAEQRPIDITIKAFWHANDFTTAQPIAAADATEIPIPASAAIDLKPIRDGIHAKNKLMAGSLLLFACGVGLDVASAMIRNKDNTQANDLLIGGATMAAIGLPVMIYSISIDPLKGKGR